MTQLPIPSHLLALDKPGKYSTKSGISHSFLGDEPKTTVSKQATPTPTPERETIKHTLIGSSKAVMGTIHVLHQLGYAQVGDWSPLLPSPNPGEVMSILVRSITVQ